MICNYKLNRILEEVKHLTVLFIIAFISCNLQAQKLSFSIGTDIPYQYYVGTTLETKPVDFSYRTGMLTPPYSDAILSVIEALGTDEIYIDLLDGSYEFGWMNSIGGYYKFPKQNNWYLGGEFRLDHLTAADCPIALLEAVTGRSLRPVNPIHKRIEARLGLTMYALGMRLGRSFSIGKNNKHQINTEISMSKHIAIQSLLSVNNMNVKNLNQKLDELLWEDVFKNHGFVGGIGFAYSYSF